MGICASVACFFFSSIATLLYISTHGHGRINSCRCSPILTTPSWALDQDSRHVVGTSITSEDPVWDMSKVTNGCLRMATIEYFSYALEVEMDV